jgi:hypothetical protein
MQRDCRQWQTADVWQPSSWNDGRWGKHRYRVAEVPARPAGHQTPQPEDDSSPAERLARLREFRSVNFLAQEIEKV